MDEISLPPDKLYFKVGEVSEIAKVPAYVLRFWETEFKNIRPRRSASGQRIYSRKDLEIILEIKRLLYKEKFTIEGAKKRLKDGGKGSKNIKKRQAETLLKDIREELQNIRDILK